MPRTGYYTTKNLDEHVSLIKQQVTRSLRDAETITLATKITSGAVDWREDPRTGKTVPVVTAWGKTYRAPAGPICKAKDSKCEIEAVWDFIVLNVRYVLDPEGYDLFRALRYMLEAGAGDCDCMVIGMAALLKALGFKVAARVISTDGRQWEHVYALVGCPKANPTRWVPLDPTVQGATPGWQYEKIQSHRDFMM